MTPTLYIMIRDDMDSMSRGKAAAQASHAANDFELALANMTNPYPWVEKAVSKWREDRTFGRALVMGANLIQMSNMISADEYARDHIVPQYLFGHIIDPTYPVKDGYITHLVPVMTAAWVFTYDHPVVIINSDKSDSRYNRVLQLVSELNLLT